MLDEYKALYEENASLIDNWKKLSKSDLCNLYLQYKEQNKDDYAEACVSGLICKYWSMITQYYYRQTTQIADDVDCYDWLIDAIMYGLEKHVWTDPESSLYGDEKGPEKALTVCIASTRITFFQYSNRGKRKLNYNALSLDLLEEDSSDGYYLQYKDTYYFRNEKLYNMVIEYFNKKDYFTAFFIDAFIHADVFNKKFDENKLRNHLKTLDKRYCKMFSSVYLIDENEVEKASKYIIDMTDKNISKHVQDFIIKFSRNTEFVNMLKDEVIS